MVERIVDTVAWPYPCHSEQRLPMQMHGRVVGWECWKTKMLFVVDRMVQHDDLNHSEPPRWDLERTDRERCVVLPWSGWWTSPQQHDDWNLVWR